MENIISNVISEMSKQYDDLCKEAFKKCGYDLDYVIKHPTAFFRYHSDFATGFRDTFYLSDPTKGNALALFEIEQISDFDKNKICVQCKIFKDSEKE